MHFEPDLQTVGRRMGVEVQGNATTNVRTRRRSRKERIDFRTRTRHDLGLERDVEWRDASANDVDDE